MASLTEANALEADGMQSFMRKRKLGRNMQAVDDNNNGRQMDLFATMVELPLNASNECQIAAVGKRRDGGTRYWCLQHKADATAKYGRQADRCRYAHLVPIKPEEVITLDIAQYRGGVALWGAVPPVYDTTRQPLDRGIHVHARGRTKGRKEIDATYRSVRLLDSSRDFTQLELTISELDAIYYMVSSVFGYEMKHVVCTYCGDSHLDKDWFSVHPHRRHLCAGCGRNFRDTDSAIGNPICRIREIYGQQAQGPRLAKRKLDLRQADYPGGIQIWGSNPAIIWTGEKVEEEGIHVHAFPNDSSEAVIDDTFSQVSIDGITINPLMVRTLMAQSALPHLENRVLTFNCPYCGEPKFDMGEDAFTPKTMHHCSRCGGDFPSTGRLRKIIGNPLVGILEQLATYAPRPPQKHEIALLPETL